MSNLNKEAEATFNWEWMFNPILWNIFVIDEDWNDYVILQKRKMAKDTIYKSKQAYDEYLKK